MPNKVKGEIRLTSNPDYYKQKNRQWRKEHPLYYVVTIKGVNYAFTKSQIKLRKRFNEETSPPDIVIVN